MFLKKIIKSINKLLPILWTGTVSAASDNLPSAVSSNIPCPSMCCNLPCYIKLFSSVLFPLTALGLLSALIYAGFLRLTAATNIEKVKKSNQIIQASIVGFIIIVLAGVVVNTMCALVGVQCF